MIALQAEKSQIVTLSVARKSEAAISEHAEVLHRGIHREHMYRSLQLQKHGELFIGTNNESLAVSLRVNDPDCAASLEC